MDGVTQASSWIMYPRQGSDFSKACWFFGANQRGRASHRTGNRLRRVHPALSGVKNIRDVSSAEALESAGFGTLPANTLKLSDVVLTVWIWRRLILAGFVLPALLGLGAAILSTPRYVAETILMVLVNRESSSAPDLSGFGPSVISVEMLKVVRAELEILQGQATIRMALQRLGPARLYPDLDQPGGLFRSNAASMDEQLDIATELFQRSLKADTDTNSNLLRVNFSFPDRALGIEAVHALVDAYLERRESLLNGSSARILGAELVRYETQLSETDREIQRVRANYGILDISQEFQQATSRNAAITQRLEAVREQRTANTAQLATAEALQMNQPSQVLTEQSSTNVAPNDDGRNILARLLQERQHLASAYNTNYPPLRDLDRRIAATRQNVAEAARTSFSTTRQSRNPQLENLSQRIISFKLEASALAGQERELELQRQAASARAVALREADVQLRELQRRRDGLETVARQLTTHEAGIRITEDPERLRNPSVKILQPANAPLKGRSLRRILVAGGGAAGLISASALGLLLTLTRRVFATPDEVQSALELPILCVTETTAAPGASRLEHSCLENLVALLLDARIGGREIGTVQLVAAGAGDERGTLGRELAAELTCRVEGGILLVDLQDDCSVHMAALGPARVDHERWIGELQILPSTTPRLYVAAKVMGSPLINPHARQAKTESQLAELRDSFRLVVLVGPDDGEGYVAQRLTGFVDANILVVCALSTNIAAAQASRESLQASGAAVLGVAFTGQRVLLPQFLTRWL